MQGQRQGLCCVLATLVLTTCTPQHDQPTPTTAEPKPTQAPSAGPTAGGSAEPTATPTAMTSAESVASTHPREDFEETTSASLPTGWTASIGAWRLTKADDATSGSHVLFQYDKGPSAQFNVALAPDEPSRDVVVGVKLRARAGRIDQGGGVVWRAKDGRNYYIARYNPLEDNYRVYFVKNGRRKQLGSADTTVDRDGWHEIACTMKSDHITCALDAEPLLDVHDKTFDEGGAVGLWTKADAQTVFDDFSVTRLDGGGDGDAP